jgi:hypothetical protein
VGEEGVTVDELLMEIQETEDQPPEGMGVQSEESVRGEGDEESGGIFMQGVGFHYLDGLTVINEFADHLPEQDLAVLHTEVTHIYAAKQRMVLIMSDSRDRYEAGLPPVQEMVPINNLTPQQIDARLIEELDFYLTGTMGPYVMRDSERARRAVEERLRSGSA